MTEIHRVGDENTDGAKVTSSLQSTVYAGNKLVAVDGSPVAEHGLAPHASPVTANGDTTVFAENKPINSKDDEDSCGHPRDAGLGTVIVGPQ